MSLGRPPKDQSREASDTSCGRGTGEDKTRSSATCTEGRGCKGSFFSRNIVSSKFSKFIDFCQQQMIHTPARASTRHPAKHRSKGLTCGLATAEHRLHCYVTTTTVVAAVVTSLHEAKHRDTTTNYPTSTLPFPFVRRQEHSQ